MKLQKRLYFWFSWPALFAYFIVSRRSRVVIQDSAGRIALVTGNFQSWYGHTDFGLPGGGIHPREAPASGAIRELYEELGLKLRTEQLTALGSAQVRQYGLQYKAFFFLVSLPAGTALVPDGKEVTSVTWCGPTELDAMALKPDVPLALDLLAARR